MLEPNNVEIIETTNSTAILLCGYFFSFRGDRTQTGQKNYFVHNLKNINVRGFFFQYNCRSCFNLHCQFLFKSVLLIFRELYNLQNSWKNTFFVWHAGGNGTARVPNRTRGIPVKVLNNVWYKKYLLVGHSFSNNLIRKKIFFIKWRKIKIFAKRGGNGTKSPKKGKSRRSLKIFHGVKWR